MKSTGEHEISRLYDQVGSGGELRQTLWGAPPFFTVAAVITVIAVTTTAGPTPVAAVLAGDVGGQEGVRKEDGVACNYGAAKGIVVAKAQRVRGGR